MRTTGREGGREREMGEAPPPTFLHPLSLAAQAPKFIRHHQSNSPAHEGTKNETIDPKTKKKKEEEEEEEEEKQEEEQEVLCQTHFVLLPLHRRRHGNSGENPAPSPPSREVKL
ncbi:hypothetical protein NL676_029782 [Syzygium grande]|nr:hypothetical protein NL676_029782 [Syzygium grande]